MLGKISLCVLGIILIATLFYYGCGGSSSGGPAYSQKDVQYSVDCSSVDCKNCDKRIDNPTIGDRQLNNTIYCYWYCGNYNGQTKKTIALIFKKDSQTNCWSLDLPVSLMDGLCK
jgi:hypothetical protein